MHWGEHIRFLCLAMLDEFSDDAHRFLFRVVQGRDETRVAKGQEFLAVPDGTVLAPYKEREER